MGKRVLAIDDNVDFLNMLEDMMKETNFDLKTLSDSRKAEEYIDEYKPELLILDIFMPERTGFNLLEDFGEKGLYGDIPKIFLTCLDDDVEKMTAKACGVSQYITKPFHPEDLMGMMKKLLDMGVKRTVDETGK